MVHQQHVLQLVQSTAATPVVTVNATMPPITVPAATSHHTLTTSEGGRAPDSGTPLHVEIEHVAVETL